MKYASLTTYMSWVGTMTQHLSLIGMASWDKKREKGEHMQRYHGHYPQYSIGAPEPKVRGPGPTSNGASKPIHAKEK